MVVVIVDISFNDEPIIMWYNRGSVKPDNYNGIYTGTDNVFWQCCVRKQKKNL